MTPASKSWRWARISRSMSSRSEPSSPSSSDECDMTLTATRELLFAFASTSSPLRTDPKPPRPSVSSNSARWVVASSWMVSADDAAVIIFASFTAALTGLNITLTFWLGWSGCLIVCGFWCSALFELEAPAET